MKGLLMILLLTSACIVKSSAATVPSTTVTYDVIYHWGIVNKVAGQGVVSFGGTDAAFHGDIQGHSIPWGGRIYTVHSTLSASFAPQRDGVSAETVRSVSGVYSKPLVGESPAKAQYRTIDGRGSLDAGKQTMEAVAIVSDMISIFYYARTLGFATMPVGHRLEIPVTRTGSRQTLYMTYQGVSDYNYGDYTSEAYRIEFRYSYDGVPDRYPITCLIGTDNRLPLKFSADLLIGHVEMCYVP